MTEETDHRDLLDVLSDEHAREILEVVGTSPRTAPDIAQLCGISRATAYRRLERLERVGLVTADLELDADGHHRNRYARVPARISLRVSPDGLGGTVTFGTSTAASRGVGPEGTDGYRPRSGTSAD